MAKTYLAFCQLRSFFKLNCYTRDVITRACAHSADGRNCKSAGYLQLTLGMHVRRKRNRLLHLVSLLHATHEVPQGVLQPVRQSQQNTESWLLSSHFDQRDVGPVKLANPSQILLRKAKLAATKFDLRRQRANEWLIFAWPHGAVLFPLCIL